MDKETFKIIILFFVIGIGFLSFTLFVNQSSDITLIKEGGPNLAYIGGTGLDTYGTVPQNYNSNSGGDSENTGYVPITPGIKDKLESVKTEEDGLSGILNLLFVWGIRLVIALSIVFVVFGAVQYMTTDAIYDKKEGKQKIQAAIGGLILALVSWLILNTINPDILKGGFLSKLKNLETTPQETNKGNDATVEPGGANNNGATESGVIDGEEEPGE